MRSLAEMRLVEASVLRTASFGAAVDVLFAAEVSAIAVLDDDGRVCGLLSDDDVVAGMFPGYLKDLHHTAFARGLDEGALMRGLERTRAQPVERHMRPAVTVEADAGPAHAAERFLHVDEAALAVVERGRFVGMLDQREFLRALLRAADG